MIAIFEKFKAIFEKLIVDILYTYGIIIIEEHKFFVI